MVLRLMAATPLVLLLMTCQSQSKPQWIEGGLYSTQGEDGNFTVVKILKLDDHGVHVRLYSNRFQSHPTTLDERTLYMAGVDHRPDEGLGMGHLPLARSSFAAWRPTYIKTVRVKDEELDGYRMWLEAKGGYF